MLQYSDLKAKLKNAINVVTLHMHGNVLDGAHRGAQTQAQINIAQKAIVNQHRKFYGLRSKYDGKGNLRQPLKS